MKKLFFLLLFSVSYSQKKDTITYNGNKYQVKEIKLLYQDTIYLCEKGISFRFTKDNIYVYKNQYYKKIKRDKQ